MRKTFSAFIAAGALVSASAWAADGTRVLYAANKQGAAATVIDVAGRHTVRRPRAVRIVASNVTLGRLDHGFTVTGATLGIDVTDGGVADCCLESVIVRNNVVQGSPTGLLMVASHPMPSLRAT